MTLSSYSGVGASQQLGQHYDTGITNFAQTSWSGTNIERWATIDAEILKPDRQPHGDPFHRYQPHQDLAYTHDGHL